MRFLKTFVFSSALLIASGVYGIAAEETFEPAKDNTLYEDPGGSLSNGAGESVFAGRTGSRTGGLIRRAVLAFDLSSIPQGATVTRVELTLQESSTRNNGDQTVELRRLTKDWGEGNSDASDNQEGQGEGDGAQAQTDDATWIHTFFDSELWDTQGGDFVDTTSASVTV